MTGIASDIVSFTDSLIFYELNPLYVLISFVALFYRDKLMKLDFINLTNGIMWYIVFFTYVNGQYSEASLMYVKPIAISYLGIIHPLVQMTSGIIILLKGEGFRGHRGLCFLLFGASILIYRLISHLLWRPFFS